MDLIKELLERPIAFYPVLARLFGDVNQAILWQQIYYWSKRCNDKDGWVYKSKEELEEETTLTRKQQDTARTKLTKNGYLKTALKKRPDGAPTIHYQCQDQLVQRRLMDKPQTSQSIDSSESAKSSIHRLPKTTPSEPKARGDGNENKKSIQRWAEIEAVFIYFSPEGKRQPWWSHKREADAVLRLIDMEGMDQIKKAIIFLRRHNGDMYCPMVNRPFQLEAKWDDILAYKRRSGL